MCVCLCVFVCYFKTYSNRIIYHINLMTTIVNQDQEAGKTPAEMVEEILSETRARPSHFTSDKYAQDWESDYNDGCLYVVRIPIHTYSLSCVTSMLSLLCV